jgi:hypothetical protein
MSRGLKMFEVLNHLERFFPNDFFVLLHLISLICLFVLICHWLACVLGLLGTMEYMEEFDLGRSRDNVFPPNSTDPEYLTWGRVMPNSRDGWIMRTPELKYGTVYQRYQIGFYWVCALLSGSDCPFKAGNDYERYFNVTMMLFSISYVSVLFAKIVDLNAKLAAKTAKYNEKVYDIMNFMRLHSIPSNFMMKVRRYLDYALKDKNAAADLSCLQDLSPGLRLELQGMLVRGNVTNHPFFGDLEDVAFNMLAIAIEMILYAPGDSIFLRGERPHGIYFICSGEVLVRSSTTSATCALGQRCFVGDVGFFLPKLLRETTVFTLDYVELFYANTARILDKFEQDPILHVNYETYQEHVKNDRSQAVRGLRLDTTTCSKCRRIGHSPMYCDVAKYREIGEDAFV